MAKFIKDWGLPILGLLLALGWFQLPESNLGYVLAVGGSLLILAGIWQKFQPRQKLLTVASVYDFQPNGRRNVHVTWFGLFKKVSDKEIIEIDNISSDGKIDHLNSNIGDVTVEPTGDPGTLKMRATIPAPLKNDKHLYWNFTLAAIDCFEANEEYVVHRGDRGAKSASILVKFAINDVPTDIRFERWRGKKHLETHAMYVNRHNPIAFWSGKTKSSDLYYVKWRWT